jgi:large subunit ribosomal protein L29
MKARELRTRSDDDLRENLRELQARLLFGLKMRQAVSGHEIKPHEARAVRRDIARIRTILRERELPAREGKA